MKIWNVTQGPLEDEDGRIFNLCLCESDEGVLYEDEIFYQNISDAYKMCTYFKTNIKPLDILPFKETVNE